MQLKYHLESKPEVPLDMADQFLWDLSQIHQVDARVSCLIFQSNFQGRCEEIAGRVNNLKSCCQFLATNPNLKTVLGVILGKKRHSRVLTDFNSLLLLFSSLWKLLERWQPTERSSGWLRRRHPPQDQRRQVQRQLWYPKPAQLYCEVRWLRNIFPTISYNFFFQPRDRKVRRRGAGSLARTR